MAAREMSRLQPQREPKVISEIKKLAAARPVLPVRKPLGFAMAASRQSIPSIPARRESA